MDTFLAFARREKAKAAGNKLRVFDWNKAATLIKKLGVDYAAAGLREDWEYTGGKIFEDGKPVLKENTYVYLASTWAIPELEIGEQIIECWEWEEKTPGWNAETYWPDSALEILNKR